MENSKVGEFLSKVNSTIGNYVDKATDYIQSIWNTKTGDNILTPNQIKDKTSENIGTEIVQPITEKPLWEQVLEKQWAREDEKQAHVEMREDTAFSRKIADLRNSGVNINALGDISGAPTGGGLTNATGPEYAMDIAEYEASIELLMQEIDQKWQGKENEKDRIKEMIKSIITAGAILGGAGMKAAAK